MSLLVLADLTYALALAVEIDRIYYQTVGRLCIEYTTQMGGVEGFWKLTKQFLHCPAMLSDPCRHGRRHALSMSQTRIRRAKVNVNAIAATYCSNLK